MRPLERYKIEDEVTLEDGTQVTIDSDYNPYQKARPLLLNNFGDYCSYCEVCLQNGCLFQTEHIQPQSLHPELRTKWENFLIGCSVCNGSGGKSGNDILSPNTQLPHKNNTYLSLVYKESGCVKVNSNIPPDSQRYAQELIDFLQLNKSPKSSLKDKDGRCSMRRKTWRKAKIFLQQFENGQVKLDMLMEYIKICGGWSIWYTVFFDHREVREALVTQFPGTARDCFDADFKPIPRHPENPVDPI